MISAGDFRNGKTLEIEGTVYQILEFQHVKPGKGAAILKTKMKNLKTGNTQERNFNASTKFEQANISKKAAQYSYQADSTYYFMDMETYDTYENRFIYTLVKNMKLFLRTRKEVIFKDLDVKGSSDGKDNKTIRRPKYIINIRYCKIHHINPFNISCYLTFVYINL